MKSVLLGLREKINKVSMFMLRDSFGSTHDIYIYTNIYIYIWDSLDSVLRIGFAFSTHDGTWIQKTVFPD